MFTNYFLVFTLIVSVLFTLNALQLIESAPSDISHPVVYRRYIRRRPPMHPHDEYSEDIVEVFHTKEKPPAQGLAMTDEDVDKFIFCDFNRHLEMCKYRINCLFRNVKLTKIFFLYKVKNIGSPENLQDLY